MTTNNDLNEPISIQEVRARDAARAASQRYTAEEVKFARAEAYKKAYDESFTEAYEKARKEPCEKGFTESIGDGAKAVRERLRAILTSAEAKGRKDLAWSLAFDTDIAPEQAIALLAKSPASAPDVATSDLIVQMSAISHPNIGRSGPGGDHAEGMDKFSEGRAAALALIGSNRHGA